MHLATFDDVKGVEEFRTLLVNMDAKDNSFVFHQKGSLSRMHLIFVVVERKNSCEKFAAIWKFGGLVVEVCIVPLS